MRVLFWSELFWPYIGGAEVFGANLLRSLSARGNQFAIVTSHNTLDLPDRDSYQDIPVYRFPFRAVASGCGLGRFREVLQGIARVKAEFQPDLIHINAVGPSAAFHVRNAGSDSVPMILTLQQEVLPNQTGESTLLHKLMTDAAHVVGVSERVLQQIVELMPPVASKASCIYNGVEPPPFSPSPLPSAAPGLLCLGRLVPAKGHETALAVVARLRGRFPGLHLVMAGDGPLRGALEQRARELGVHGCVQFLGWVEPACVYETIDRAACVLMPSFREGLPVAAVQAAVMGRPIIASDVGGLAEVVRQGESGLLVAPNDVEGFVAAVAQLLEDPLRAAEMGRAARIHALRTFDWNSTVERYQRLYAAVAVPNVIGERA